MKKSIFVSAFAAAAILTAGAGANASAQEVQKANIPCKSQVHVYSSYGKNQQELNKILQSFGTKELENLANKYFPNSQMKISIYQKNGQPVKKETVIPKQDNNQKVNNQPNSNAKTTTPAPSKNSQTTNNTPASNQENVSTLNAYEKKVVELTNAERQKRGLKPLIVDDALSKVAREKSLDMQRNNYFSHTSPTYGSPFDMMKKFGISYKTAGENIAMGQRTPEEVVNAWMNSEGHRANILNPNFTHIGVGYVENGHYWTQQFIGK